MIQLKLLTETLIGNGDELEGQGGKDSDRDKQCDDEPPSKKQRKVSGDKPWGAVGLGLDKDDHNMILNQNWLTDKHMNTCYLLLKLATSVSILSSPHHNPGKEASSIVYVQSLQSLFI